MRSRHEKKQISSRSIPKSIHTYTGTYQKKFTPHARAYQQVHGYRNTGCITHKYTGTHRTDGIHIICTGIQTKYTGTATRVVPIWRARRSVPLLISLIGNCCTGNDLTRDKINLLCMSITPTSTTVHRQNFPKTCNNVYLGN